MKVIMYIVLITFLPVISFIGCTQEITIIEVGNEKDLIPEGIAFFPEEAKIYLSSIHKDKIVEYDLNTGAAKDLITSGEYNYKHGLGLEIVDSLLFALSSETISGISSSILLVYDLQNDHLVKSFRLKDSISHFMNDLAISKDLKVFITDTERHLVYNLQFPEGTIRPYLSDEQIRYPNGITISDEGDYLYVDSWSEGLRIVDLGQDKIVNSKYADTDKWVAVDGLKYHHGDLYGIRNGGTNKASHGLVKIQLTDDKNEIDTILPVLIGHPKMNIPTTFCIDGDYAYILANSQLEALDQEENKVISPENLTKTYVIKYKL